MKQKHFLPASFLVSYFLAMTSSSLCGQTVIDWTPGITVPDNNPVGVADTRNVTFNPAAVITGLQVRLTLTDGWNGDLYASLVHDSGFTVLLNRPGVTEFDPGGSASSGMNVTFSDSAANDIHTAIPESGLVTGTWQPDARTADPSVVTNLSPRTAFLSSFNESPVQGNWTLYLADNAAADTSILAGWGLTIQSEIRAFAMWDANGNTSGVGGVGTWSSGTQTWATSHVGTSTNTQDVAAQLVFRGTGGAVTVSGTVAPQAGLSFQSNGYSLNGGTVNLAGATSAANALNVATGITATINSELSGSAGFSKTGAGDLILSGSNSYTGDTTVSAGGLRGTTLSAFGTGGINMSGGRLELASSAGGDYGASLNVTADAPVTSDRASQGAGVVQTLDTLTMADRTLTVAQGGNVTSGTAGLRFSGNTTLLGDAIFNVQQGAELQLMGDVTGAYGVTKTGAGKLTLGGLSGSSTYTGNTLISGGELSLMGSSSFASGTQITVADGAFLHVGSGSTVSNVTINSRPEGLIFESVSQVDTVLNSSGTLTEASAMMDGQQTINSGVVISAAGDFFGSDPISVVEDRIVLAHNSTIQVTQAFSMSANKGMRIDGGQANIQTDANLVMANRITGDGGLVKRGTAQLTISGLNDYRGATRVETGRLVIANTGSLGVLDSATSTVTVDSGSEIVVDGTVNGPVFIDAGATLSGSGTIVGHTTISGTHSPGNSPGIQTITGNSTYSGGVTVWELTNNTTSNSPLAYDQIVVTGSLTFTGATTLDLVFNLSGSAVDWSNGFWASSRSWTVYDVSGTTTGVNNLTIASTFRDGQNDLLSASRPGSTFSLSQQGSDVLLNYTAIPETSVTLLGGLSALLLLRRRRQQ